MAEADFDIDEHRLRARLYLHDGLDVDQVTRIWSAQLGIPTSQFQQPYRPTATTHAPANIPTVA